MVLEKAGLNLGKEIIAWTRANGKSLLATKPVKVDTAGLRLAPQLEDDVVQIQSKKGFCQEFWGRMVKKRLRYKNGEIVSLGTPTTVEHHWSLYSFNGMLNGTSPVDLGRALKPSFYHGPELTVKEGIFITDFGFKKKLSPITENITVYRGIPSRPPFMKAENYLFEEAINLKPGEIIAMREYAYVTTNINYAAKGYTGDKGILYEINIPKGARISTRGHESVMPRYSRFKCISNETLEDGSHKIKLEYILPDESWRNA